MIGGIIGVVVAVGLAGGAGWALATSGGGRPGAAPPIGGSSATQPPATGTAPTGAPTTSATTSPAITVTIVGYGSGLCVTVPNDVGSSALTLEQCGSGASQFFTLKRVGGGYELAGQSSGACASVKGAITGDGTAIDQTACGQTTRQTWYMRRQSGGDGQEYRFVDRASGKCLDAYGAATTAGTTLDQWPCKSNPFQDGNQVWRVVRQ